MLSRNFNCSAVIQPPSGSSTWALTSDLGSNQLYPDWSSDDSQIVFNTGGGADVFTVGVVDDGQCVIGASTPQLIASDGKGIFGLWNPSWRR